MSLWTISTDSIGVPFITPFDADAAVARMNDKLHRPYPTPIEASDAQVEGWQRTIAAYVRVLDAIDAAPRRLPKITWGE